MLLLASLAMHPKIEINVVNSLNPTNRDILKPHKTLNPTISLSLKPQTSSFFQLPTLKTTQRLQLSPSKAELIFAQDQEPSIDKEKLRVVVKPMEKPRLVLKLIWMEKAIGIGLNQVIPGHGTIPLSPYYFWPVHDAWDQLKHFLESKPWISRKQMVILLNQATDIINLWRETRAHL